MTLACAVLTASSGCGGGKSDEGARTLHRVVDTSLRGGGEVAPGPAAGSGTAVLRLNPKTGNACWTLAVGGVGTALSAHVHKAPPGEEGPVVIPLGDRFSLKGCVLAPRKTVTGVARHPRAYYVNVHTRKYLNGAVRGQLRPRS